MYKSAIDHVDLSTSSRVVNRMFFWQIQGCLALQKVSAQHMNDILPAWIQVLIQVSLGNIEYDIILMLAGVV